MKACSGRRGQLDGTGSGREESGASSAGETARVTRRGVLLIPGAPHRGHVCSGEYTSEGQMEREGARLLGEPARNHASSLEGGNGA